MALIKMKIKKLFKLIQLPQLVMIYLLVLPLGFVTSCSHLFFQRNENLLLKLELGMKKRALLRITGSPPYRSVSNHGKVWEFYNNKNTSGDKPNIFWVEFSEGVISGWGDRIIYNDNDINEGESLLNPWIIEFLH